MVDKEYLNMHFYYTDGNLFYKDTNKAIVSRVSCWEYLQVRIKRKTYQLHRLIYIYHFGEIEDGLVIDHINKNKVDNKIENLRAVTRNLNALNQSGTTNVKRIFKKTSKNIWRGSYSYQGKFHSKDFDTYERALNWVENEKNKLFANFKGDIQWMS